MLENGSLDELDILAETGKHEEHQHGNKRKSLGRGLGALLGDDEFNIDEALNDTPAQPVRPADDEVDVNLLYPSPFQPRKDFDEEAARYEWPADVLPHLDFQWEEDDEESIHRVCPRTFDRWWGDDTF